MPCRYHFCCWLDPFFSKYVFIKLYFFFCYLDFHSQSFTNHRTTTSTRFTDTYTLAGRLLQRSHLCTYLAAGLKPGTFGFQAQVTEHEPLTTRLYLFLVKWVLNILPIDIIYYLWLIRETYKTDLKEISNTHRIKDKAQFCKRENIHFCFMIIFNTKTLSLWYLYCFTAS